MVLIKNSLIKFFVCLFVFICQNFVKQKQVILSHGLTKSCINKILETKVILCKKKNAFFFLSVTFNTICIKLFSCYFRVENKPKRGEKKKKHQLILVTFRALSWARRSASVLSTIQRTQLSFSWSRCVSMPICATMHQLVLK